MLHSLYANRLKQTMTDIRNNPDHWKQTNWHCGTSHCFAGFAEVRAIAESGNQTLLEALNTNQYEHKILNEDLINNQYFGLTKPGWNTLVNGTNTLEQLAFIIDNLIENNGSIKIKYANYAPIENFSNMDLSHADLSYSNFEYADFNNASLNKANLSYSNLSGAQFKSALLDNATVIRANLTNSNLDYADLSEANFTESDFTGASMRLTKTARTNMTRTIR